MDDDRTTDPPAPGGDDGSVAMKRRGEVVIALYVLLLPHLTHNEYCTLILLFIVAYCMATVPILLEFHRHSHSSCLMLL